MNLSVPRAAVALACASLALGHATPTADNATENIGGTQAIYGNIPPDQIEFLSTGDRIKSVAASGSMMAIWETLEHGERVECLDCIPSVEPLLYDTNPRTREIAAWWLRRRVFGVFGKGEVYERTLQTLANDAGSEAPRLRGQRARRVPRRAGHRRLRGGDRARRRPERPRRGGDGARSAQRRRQRRALARRSRDADARVKLAALALGRPHQRVHGRRRPSRASPATATRSVRRRAAELLGSMRATDAVDGLIALAKDPDANVRNAACHALGADPRRTRAGRPRGPRQNDPDGLVRDQAQDRAPPLCRQAVLERRLRTASW